MSKKLSHSLFKVYGEERSATTYLEQLLDRNTDMSLLSNKTKPLEKWKHGFPHYWGDDVLHVFIVRDVYEWIRSVMNVNGGRFNGLTEPFGNVEGGKQHDHWQSWDNILECRYAKIDSYSVFMSRYPSVMLKTGYLKYNPHIIKRFTNAKNVTDIKKHTRLNIEAKDDPDRAELTDKERSWIDRNKNEQIEQFVDNLTYIDAL